MQMVLLLVIGVFFTAFAALVFAVLTLLLGRIIGRLRGVGAGRLVVS